MKTSSLKHTLAVLTLLPFAVAAEQKYSPPTTSAEGLYQEGSRLQKAGRAADAITAWRTLIERFPESNRAGCAATYIGQQQLSDKNFDEAEKSFLLAAEKFGHHKYGNGVEVGGYAYFYLTNVYCDTGRYDKAVESLQALVKHYPYASGHRSGDALMSLRAKKWFHAKLVAEGCNLGFLDDLIAKQKSPANFNRLTAQQLCLVGYELQNEGEKEKAVEAFKTIVWKYPKESFSAWACVSVFEIQQELKQYDAALETARMMIERFPAERVGRGGPMAANGLFGIGVVHFERQNFKEAADAFQQAALDFPAATDKGGRSLRSLVVEHYEKKLLAEGYQLQGLLD
jgi:TolA-binding protein